MCYRLTTKYNSITTSRDQHLGIRPVLSDIVTLASPIEDREAIQMDLTKWSKANADYGRKLLDSGIEGARSGEEAFLDGEPLTPFLSESVQRALKPAAIGACIGVLGSCSGYRQKSIVRTLVYGLLGGVIGLGAGIAWESRCLTASVASGALRNIARVRDERWLTRHPINYA